MFRDPQDLRAVIQTIGFTEEETRRAMDELEAYRSIPGTTLIRFLRRAMASVDEGERMAFLKGLVVGAAIVKRH